jgi:hypothetical protein
MMMNGRIGSPFRRLLAGIPYFHICLTSVFMNSYSVFLTYSLFWTYSLGLWTRIQIVYVRASANRFPVGYPVSEGLLTVGIQDIQGLTLYGNCGSRLCENPDKGIILLSN